MKRLILALVFLCCSQPSMATDLCAGLTGKRLSIVANGRVGETHPTGLKVSQSNGTYSFTTSIHFKGEPLTPQQVSGTCKNRHIVFTRANNVPGGPSQEYDAWIFEKQPQKMAGLFTHSNQKTYGWYAELKYAPNYPSCKKFDSTPCSNDPGPKTKTCVSGVWPGPTSTSTCNCMHETNDYWEWACK